MEDNQHPQNDGHADAFQLGDWWVYPTTGRLAADNQTRKLEPRVMDVLVFLAKHQGQVVSRDDLEQAVWRGALVSYDAVTGAVIKLRKALNDRAKQPRYIETIPKKGYRLIAEVIPASPLPSKTQVDRSATRSQSRRVYLLGAAALLAVALIWRFTDSPEPHQDTPALTLPTRPSLAVMPFENLSGDPADDYFSDGMTDDLITDLSQLQGLFVIGRHSSFSFKDRTLEPSTIARALGVRYLMVGSVRRDDQTLRVNTQLIDAVRGEQIWAQRFDGETHDIFAVQDRINAEILNALALRLSDNDVQRVSGTATTSPVAYDAYLKGMQHFWRGSADDYDQALQYLQGAIALDPDFANAHAAVAAIHWQAYRRGWYRNQPWMGLLWEKTMHALEQALKQPTALAYLVDVGINITNRRFDTAIAQARKATQQFPNDAHAHLALAEALSFAGNPADAKLSAQLGLRLDPRFPAPYRFAIGRADFELDDFRGAITSLTDAVTLNASDALPRTLLVSALAHLNRIDEGQRHLAELNAIYQRDHLRRLNIRDLGPAWPYKNPSDLARIREGLRKLGVDEW